MRTHTYPAVTAALFASLAAASVVTAGTATAAPAGRPDLAVTAAPSVHCGVAVTNKGTATAVNSTVYTPAYGGVTTKLGDIEPGATKTTGYLDCEASLFPTVVIASTPGDSNPFNNVGFVQRP